MAKKLFIPGPTEVGPRILQALATPQIGHRSGDFQELYARVHSRTVEFLRTKQHVYFGTCSATGLMEGAVRNLVEKRCLNLTCGAFSERWHQITLANGKQADAISVEWGDPNTPASVDAALSAGKYDLVTVVHNETSTGVMNPLAEIAAVVKKHPGVLLAVDAVTSMAVVDIPIDELGLDVVFAGSQKGFGLPAGLTVFTVSDAAMERAKSIPHRGYYFDFIDYEKYHLRNQTPATPAIPLLYALDLRLADIASSGRERWFARHLEMAERTRRWGREYFGLLAKPGYESVSLTTIKNTRSISVDLLNKELGKRGMAISNGYGKLKEKAFRIGHMGDIGIDDLDVLLRSIEEILEL
jgi:predicted phosphoserine aminotransferase